MSDSAKCSICKEEFSYSDLYEYRDMIACEKCFDKAQEQKDYERQQIIDDIKFRTDRFKGLDLSDSTIGKANKKILKSQIEIAKREKYNG